MLKSKLMMTFAISACIAAQGANAQSDSPDMSKIGGVLGFVYEESLKPTARTSESQIDLQTPAAVDLNQMASITDDGYVKIDAVASGRTKDLISVMERLGGRKLSSSGRIVSAEFPISRLGELGVAEQLKSARAVVAKTRQAAEVINQGDRAFRANVARRRFRVDGTGLTIGVMSDSFACPASGASTTFAQDVAAGELPPNIRILDDLTSGCIDEGRGMAQLIHDTAPGANIIYHTAFNGEADFADGIRELAFAGADIIVDDIGYAFEFKFQDSEISQAVTEVAELGVAYFSAAGNDGSQGAYFSPFRGVNANLGGINGRWHDFNAGPAEDLLSDVTLDYQAAGAVEFARLITSWDSPNFDVSGAPGAQNDVDLVLFDGAGNPLADCGGLALPPGETICAVQNSDGGGGDNAIEDFIVINLAGNNPGQLQLGILAQTGNAPGIVHFNAFNGGIDAFEYDLDGPTSYGHAMAAGGQGVAASSFSLTAPFRNDPNTRNVRREAGLPNCRPACLNDFSSLGGLPIFIDTNGQRLTTPEVRLQPAVTGPDGGNTTFFGGDTLLDDDDGDGQFTTGEAGELPNFFGTSASAPNVAAVAALMYSVNDDSGIITQDNRGRERFRMCIPAANGNRSGGSDRLVAERRVPRQVGRGWLLGSCNRVEAAEVYDILQTTARNIRIRVNRFNGQTLETFTERRENGRGGYDFHSGFGLVDANAAVRTFRERHSN